MCTSLIIKALFKTYFSHRGGFLAHLKQTCYYVHNTQFKDFEEGRIIKLQCLITSFVTCRIFYIFFFMRTNPQFPPQLFLQGMLSSALPQQKKIRGRRRKIRKENVYRNKKSTTKTFLWPYLWISDYNLSFEVTLSSINFLMNQYATHKHFQKCLHSCPRSICQLFK